MEDLTSLGSRNPRFGSLVFFRSPKIPAVTTLLRSTAKHSELPKAPGHPVARCRDLGLDLAGKFTSFCASRILLEALGLSSLVIRPRSTWRGSIATSGLTGQSAANLGSHSSLIVSLLSSLPLPPIPILSLLLLSLTSHVRQSASPRWILCTQTRLPRPHLRSRRFARRYLASKPLIALKDYPCLAESSMFSIISRSKSFA